jgi:Transglutaminase-like superfamily
VYEWATASVPKPPPGEPFAADSNDVGVGVAVSSPEHWSDIARWYAGLSRDRDAVTPELDARLAAIVQGATTAADSLKAVHRWVAQDFRYVSIALGIAGYQPRTPAAVLESKYGDCKDKATLFVALARRMGFQAFPVLLSAEGGVDSTLPTVQQFDHMIAAVERPGGYRFVDLTAADVPWGELPASEYGSFALLVRPDGRGEEVRLPLDSAGANLATDSLVGSLSADGIFTGRLSRTRSGRTQVPLRAALSRSFTPNERAEIAHNVANEEFDGADGDSLQLFDGRDLNAPARIAVVIRNAPAVSSAGPNSGILRLPLRPLFSSGQVDEVASHVPRRYPIDMAQVLGPGAFDQLYLITLPEGWRARLPPPVRVSGAYGVYASSYAQDGRQLRIERSGRGVRGIQPPDKVADLVTFLRAIARDDARLILIDHP